MIKPFNKHIASLMVIELQLSSPNTFCLNTSFVDYLRKIVYNEQILHIDICLF